MEKKDNKELSEVLKTSNKVLRVIYALLIIIGAYVILRIFNELKLGKAIVAILTILAPLFLGIVIAWLLTPFIKWLEKKGVRKNLGVILSYVILLGIIVLFFSALIPLLYNQIIELVESLPSIFSSVQSWLLNLLNKVNEVNVIDVESLKSSLSLKLTDYTNNLSTSLPGTIINFVSGLISSLGTFGLGLIIGFFLLMSTDNVGQAIIETLPKKKRNNLKELFDAINKSLRNYVNGALIDSFVVFSISSIAFAIIGLKSPLLFGLFCGLMNIIPFLGPYIGGAPAVIVAFSQGLGIGIAVLIAIVIIQALEGNFLQTLILSKTTKLNPVTIILGLLVFGHFFGIIGMLLSTPIIGVLKVIYLYFDEKYDLFYIKK